MRSRFCLGAAVLLCTAAAVAQTAPAQRAWAAMATIRGTDASGRTLTGAGFVAAPNGTIVTNLHLVQRLNNLSVELSNGDRFDAPAVVASDERRDLAILRIPGFDLPYVELGNSNQLRTGEAVMLVTAAHQAIATGTVLGTIAADGLHLIQVSFPSNATANGGLLINANGQAVGVVGFPGPRESSAVAVPINYARGMIEGVIVANEQPALANDVRRPPSTGIDHPVEGDRGTDDPGTTTPSAGARSLQQSSSVAQSPSTVAPGSEPPQPRAAVPQQSTEAPVIKADATTPTRAVPEHRRVQAGVHRIFVDSLGEGEGADMLRDKIVHTLTQQRFVVVQSAQNADAVLSGSGTWSHERIKSLRARLVTGDQRVLWSGEVSAGGWVRSASSSIADKLVEKMMDALANQ